MSPRKLTAADKEEILDLYRLPRETTSTLAERFKVSSSTISRFLKSRLNEGEYEELIQQKRLSRTPSGAAQVMSEFKKQQTEPEPAPPATLDVAVSPVVSPPSKATTPVVKKSVVAEPVSTPPVASDQVEAAPSVPRPIPESTTGEPEQSGSSPSSAPVRRMAAASRRRIASPRPRQPVEQQLEIPVVPSTESAGSTNPSTETETVTPATAKIPTRRARASVGGFSPPPKPLLVSTKPSFASDLEDGEDEDEGVHALEEMLGEDIGLDEEDDWDEEEDDDDGDLPISTGSRFSDVQVLPLSDAQFPRTCYLVIDRAAELITQPLQEFQDLGHIPGSEASQRTLPVFDNHRVARRFSKRTQRVIKVPDSILFEKTRTYLQARGITRLLLDGQVYSL